MKAQKRKLFHPPTAVELIKIETLSRTWDADPELQQKHDWNFYNFLAETMRKQERWNGSRL